MADASAAKELRRLLQSADEGAHVAPDKITLAHWIPQWLETKGRSIEGQTLDRYEDLLNCHVLPKLGSIRLQKIAAGDIDRSTGISNWHHRRRPYFTLC
jgi:integrase